MQTEANQGNLSVNHLQLNKGCGCSRGPCLACRVPGVPCFRMEQDNEAVADSATTPALSPSSNTSISHSHKKSTTERWQLQALGCAILCLAAVVRAASAFMCRITPGPLMAQITVEILRLQPNILYRLEALWKTQDSVVWRSASVSFT